MSTQQTPPLSLWAQIHIGIRPKMPGDNTQQKYSRIQPLTTKDHQKCLETILNRSIVVSSPQLQRIITRCLPMPSKLNTYMAMTTYSQLHVMLACWIRSTFNKSNTTTKDICGLYCIKAPSK